MSRRRPLTIATLAAALACPATAAAADTRLEAEAFPLTPATAGKRVSWGGATNGTALKIWGNARATRSVGLSEGSDQLLIRAAGLQCAGAPVLSAEVHGRKVFEATVSTTSLKTYSARVDLPGWSHGVTLRFENDFKAPGCDRDVVVDDVKFVGRSSPTPSGTIDATPPSAVPATLPPGTRTTTTPAAVVPPPTIGLMPGYALAFNEEFSGPLSTKRWNLYGNAPHHRRNLSVAGGELRIAANATSTGGLSSLASWTHGIFEIRGRMDPGAGYTNVFMLWPASGRYQQDNEIDISEIPWATRNKSRSTVHHDLSYVNFKSHWVDGPSSDFTTFHTWTVVWTPQKVDFYLDGVKYMTELTAGAVPNTPHRWAMQTGKGPKPNWLPTPSPGSSSMAHIDYVRTWQPG